MLEILLGADFITHISEHTTTTSLPRPPGHQANMDSLETAKTPPVEEATESLPTEPDTATQYVETGISASPELIGGDLVEVSSKSEPPADTPDGDNDGSSHSVSADENDRGTDDEYEPTSADDDEEFGEKSSSGGIPKRKKAPFKKVAIPVNERLANHVRDEKPCMASDEEDLQDEIFMLEMTEATLRNREHRRAKEGQTLSAKDKEKLEKTQKRLTELAREWPHLARKKNQGDMPDTSDVKPNHAKSRAASLKISTKGSRKRKTGDSGEAPQSAKKIKTNPQKPEAQRKKVAPVRKTLGSSSVLSDVLSGRTSIHDRASSDGVSAKPIVASQLQDQLDQMRDRAFQLPNVDKSRIKADEKNLQIARGAFGPSWVSPVDGGWLIKNMRIPLYDHQLDGGGWMINRERFDDEPQGGILADEMGLGKTLTCLALIVKRRPGRGEEVSPTLVLVPNEAMAVQWLAEIERHCIDLFAQRYRRNEKLTTATLKTVSVLVATYSEVERCWNQHMPTTNEKTFKKQPLDQSLHLFNVTFHRIMYDECHIIKNHLSKTAKAVFNLKAKYRWLISATPTPNDPDELYPYLKILGLPWTENIKLYHENFYNKKLNNTDKLQPIIQKIMLRRLTKSTVMGMELFDDVPETKSEIIRKAFSVEEKIIYDAVVKTLQKELHEQSWNLNLKSKSKGNSLGDTKEESEKLLHKVLQLHKLTAHPFMFESMLAKTFPLEQLAEIRSDLEAYGGKSSLIDQIGRMFPQKDHKQDHDMSAGSFGKSQHGGIFNMKPQLDMTLKRRAIEERFCPGPLCARREIPVEALRLEVCHSLTTYQFSSLMLTIKVRPYVPQGLLGAPVPRDQCGRSTSLLPARQEENLC